MTNLDWYWYVIIGALFAMFVLPMIMSLVAQATTPRQPPPAAAR